MIPLQAACNVSSTATVPEASGVIRMSARRRCPVLGTWSARAPEERCPLAIRIAKLASPASPTLTVGPTRICTANATYCYNGNVNKCGPDGTTSSLYTTCTSAYYCKTTSSTTAVCAADVCTAGTPVCNGNIVSTCLADGSGPDPNVNTQDCTATGQACDSGQCKNIICSPNQKFCSGTTVQLCNATGTGSTTSVTCAGNQYCSPTGSNGQAGCVADVCAQGQPACDGEILATCASDGSGYTNLGTDCSLSGQVCNQSVACSAAAVDTFGSTTYAAGHSPGFVGNMYRMDKARTLTDIELYLTISGTYAFAWAVYEGSTQTGSFSLIFQTTTTGGGTATFMGSGTVSVPLQAGKYYVIGAFITGGNFTAPYAYLSTAYQSFGMAIGGITISGTSPPGTATPTVVASPQAMYERITTTL